MRQITTWIVALILLCATLAQADQSVGEVRSVIGVAQLIAGNGDKRDVTQGTQLHVGDTLKTTAGAHLHLRMVDDALLSLRPDSELKITGYTYKPGAPEQTNIRFDLVRGTVRSVTGKGGESAKDKFRMNTSVAAIGVRGTDFIALSDAETTLVNVQSGAIVLAPLGEGCQASALGPCQTVAARELNAGMRNMMLKFIRGTDEPVLMPLGEGLQILPVPVVSGNATRPQIAQTQTTQTAQAQAQTQTAQASVIGTGDVPLISAGKTLDNLVAQQPSAQQAPAQQAPAQQPLIEQPPPVKVELPHPVHYQMVWGRWGALTSEGDLGRTFLEASQGREVTVGSFTAGLFRDNAGSMALPLTGHTEFTLRDAQVAQSSTGIAGQVQNGSLGVDFDAKNFSTKLDIQHPALTGTVTLNAFGTLRSDGMLHSLSGISNGTVAGALSRDGTEAGYQFQLPSAAGNLTGTTLWVK